MPQPITTGVIPSAYDVALTSLVGDEMNRPDVVDDFLGKESYSGSPSKQFYKTASFAGLGPFQTHGETLPIPFDAPGPDYDKTTAYIDYALATMITRNAREDQLFPVFDDLPSQFADSYKLLRNLIGARFLQDLATGTYYTSPDRKAVISLTHSTLNDTPNRANTLATQVSAGYQAGIDLITVMARQKDKRGYPSPDIKPGDSITIIAQPEDWANLYNIFGPKATMVPGGFSTDPNALTGNFNFNVIMNPYLDFVTTVGRPFYFIRGGKKSAFFVDRRPMEMSSKTDEMTKHLTIGGSARFGLHVEDWRTYYASGFTSVV